MHMAMEEKGVDAMVVTGLDETACKSVFQVHTVWKFSLLLNYF